MLISEPSPVLAIKLVTRISKTLSHGVQSGSITLKDLEDSLSTNFASLLKLVLPQATPTRHLKLRMRGMNGNASPKTSKELRMGLKMHVQDLPLFPLGEKLRTYKYIIRFIYVYRRFSTRDSGLEYYTVRSAEIE